MSARICLNSDLPSKMVQGPAFAFIALFRQFTAGVVVGGMIVAVFGSEFKKFSEHCDMSHYFLLQLLLTAGVSD